MQYVNTNIIWRYFFKNDTAKCTEIFHQQGQCVEMCAAVILWYLPPSGEQFSNMLVRVIPKTTFNYAVPISWKNLSWLLCGNLSRCYRTEKIILVDVVSTDCSVWQLYLCVYAYISYLLGQVTLENRFLISPRPLPQ